MSAKRLVLRPMSHVGQSRYGLSTAIYMGLYFSETSNVGA